MAGMTTHHMSQDMGSELDVRRLRGILAGRASDIRAAVMSWISKYSAFCAFIIRPGMLVGTLWILCSIAARRRSSTGGRRRSGSRCRPVVPAAAFVGWTPEVSSPTGRTGSCRVAPRPELPTAKPMASMAAVRLGDRLGPLLVVLTVDTRGGIMPTALDTDLGAYRPPCWSGPATRTTAMIPTTTTTTTMTMSAAIAPGCAHCA